MIKPINRNPLTLAQPAQPATKSDLATGQDLQDTLAANSDRCVGMAANMIGVNKAIIIAQLGPFPVVMYNPQITARTQPFKTTEGCLSLDGERPTTRDKQITVRYQDSNFAWHTQQFVDFPAQIIQHECDHLQGTLI